MRVDVVTFFSPRPKHEAWMNYLPMLQLQARSALRARHQHYVVTDCADWLPVNLKGVLVSKTPESLMKAILAMQCDYLEHVWDGKHPVLLVDVDCLIARNLAEAFDRSRYDFDLLLTHRESPTSPIQNGAMYVQAGNKPGVVEFYRHALSMCEDHWGGDQEAISRAAAPIPKLDENFILRRREVNIFFGPIIRYNVSPKTDGQRHKKDPFVIHFKGKTKAWMRGYAHNFLGLT